MRPSEKYMRTLLGKQLQENVQIFDADFQLPISLNRRFLPDLETNGAICHIGLCRVHLYIYTLYNYTMNNIYFASQATVSIGVYTATHL